MRPLAGRSRARHAARGAGGVRRGRPGAARRVRERGEPAAVARRASAPRARGARRRRRGARASAPAAARGNGDVGPHRRRRRRARSRRRRCRCWRAPSRRRFRRSTRRASTCAVLAFALVTSIASSLLFGLDPGVAAVAHRSAHGAQRGDARRIRQAHRPSARRRRARARILGARRRGAARAELRARRPRSIPASASTIG